MTSKADIQSRSSDTPSSDPQSDETDELSPDDIFHILQTNRRRDTIEYLLEKDDIVKMRDVAEYVAAKENETTVARLTSTQRQRVYIPLYQSHLPKLDEEGIIEYNKPRGIVRPTDRLEIFRPYLEVSNGEFDRSNTRADRPTATRVDTAYFSTAIGASISLLFASAMGMLSLPGSVLGAIITCLFMLATAATNRFDAQLSKRFTRVR